MLRRSGQTKTHFLVCLIWKKKNITKCFNIFGPWNGRKARQAPKWPLFWPRSRRQHEMKFWQRQKFRILFPIHSCIYSSLPQIVISISGTARLASPCHGLHAAYISLHTSCMCALFLAHLLKPINSFLTCSTTFCFFFPSSINRRRHTHAVLLRSSWVTQRRVRRKCTGERLANCSICLSWFHDLTGVMASPLPRIKPDCVEKPSRVTSSQVDSCHGPCLPKNQVKSTWSVSFS